MLGSDSFFQDQKYVRHYAKNESHSPADICILNCSKQNQDYNNILTILTIRVEDSVRNLIHKHCVFNSTEEGLAYWCRERDKLDPTQSIKKVYDSIKVENLVTRKLQL